MLWLKALHVVFVVAWFAGLFYLPRLFVYHAVTTDAPGVVRLGQMERRLYFIMSLGAVLAVVFGLAMIAAAPGYLARAGCGPSCCWWRSSSATTSGATG